MSDESNVTQLFRVIFRVLEDLPLKTKNNNLKTSNDILPVTLWIHLSDYLNRVSQYATFGACKGGEGWTIHFWHNTLGH